MKWKQGGAISSALYIFSPVGTGLPDGPERILTSMGKIRSYNSEYAKNPPIEGGFFDGPSRTPVPTVATPQSASL